MDMTGTLGFAWRMLRIFFGKLPIPIKLPLTPAEPVRELRKARLMLADLQGSLPDEAAGALFQATLDWEVAAFYRDMADDSATDPDTSEEDTEEDSVKASYLLVVLLHKLRGTAELIGDKQAHDRIDQVIRMAIEE